MPAPGQVVRVRSRQYLVEDVVPPPEPGHQTLVRLSCLDDDAQGVQAEVLWESELDAEVLGASSWEAVAKRGFDDPSLFAAYLDAQRWSCVTSTDPKLFQAPYRAGIDIKVYQLEPLRKALALPRVNLFIADDVGLGKTIEAGLILREMLLRQKVRRFVVACPPSVVLQWRDELESRFGLTCVVLDRDYVLQKRRERGFGINPWDTHTRFILSHALLRDETYAAGLRDWLGSFAPGSLLILDEAHNAAPASGSKYAIDSKLTRVVREIARRFEHRLFLSATPHNGHSNSFSALLEILDPQRFCRGVKVANPKLLEPIMVRRLKEDLREIVPGIPKRSVIQFDIDHLLPDAPELVLPELLEEYRELREAMVEGASRSVQNAAALVCIGLQKRLLSSIEAFARTLKVHRRALDAQAARAQAAARQSPAATTSDLRGLAQTRDGDEAEEQTEEQLHAEEATQMELATEIATSEPTGEARAAELLARQKALLDRMTRIAEESRQRPDPRVCLLVDWIRQNLCPDLPPLGSDEPVRAQQAVPP
jgi:hypothetical protein